MWICVLYIIQYHEELLITSIFPLYQVSERAGHIIQYDKFYIHELDELIDIRNDYVTWIQRQMYPMVSVLLMSVSCCNICLCLGLGMNNLFIPLYPQGHDGVVTLCRYPFVFDAQAKTTLLQTDAVIQMQVSVSCRVLCGFCVPYSPRRRFCVLK